MIGRYYRFRYYPASRHYREGVYKCVDVGERLDAFDINKPKVKRICLEVRNTFFIKSRKWYDGGDLELVEGKLK